MSLGQLLASGAAAVFNPGMFLMVCVAIILGTIFGALPGVSATMAVALGLTFTYTMEPIPAIVFLVAIYCSSITGGSITAILFKIPGVPSSAPTTFDGYPMAQRGEAGKALGQPIVPGPIFSSDCFYEQGCDKTSSSLLAKLGVLCVEMEAAALYLNAAAAGKNALALLTISDSLVTGEALPAEDRQNTFTKMMEIALTIA